MPQKEKRKRILIKKLQKVKKVRKVKNSRKKKVWKSLQVTKNKFYSKIIVLTRKS